MLIYHLIKQQNLMYVNNFYEKINKYIEEMYYVKIKSNIILSFLFSVSTNFF